jgi:HSP20 family protein
LFEASSNWFFTDPTQTTNKTGDTVRFNETADMHTVEIDLPGVKKTDAKIDTSIDGNNIRFFITANRTVTHRGGKRNETFKREFSLNLVKPELLKAKLEDGVLTITVEKASKNKANKQIIIE